MQKKGKQVASTTKWGLGEHIVLRLVECLSPTASFDIFMDNYFTSFHLVTHLGVNNIQPDVLNKNSLNKWTIIGDKELQKKKKELGHFEQRSGHQAKKQRNLCGWLERHQGDLHSFF